MKRNPVHVTLAQRPRLFRLMRLISQVLKSNQYTNDGPLARRLEMALIEKFDVKHVVLMNNGTSPLLFLMSLFPKGSKVLTTPYSFIATSSAIKLLGLELEYIDVSRRTGLVEVDQVRSKLEAEHYSAMLFTHVYGQPCAPESLEELSLTYGVPLFFDAAHAIGVRHANQPLFSFGLASSTSFHATKLLSTGEGGALITNDEALAGRARLWRNFGIDSGEIRSLGVNAKMSEFQAALGLANLKNLDREIRRRHQMRKAYETLLTDFDVTFLDSPNNSYFPVVLPSKEIVLAFLDELKKDNIYPRRYFYPSLDSLDFLGAHPPQSNSHWLSERVVCLPSGPDATPKVLKNIFDALNRVMVQDDRN